MLNDVSPSAATIAIKQTNNTTNATISEDIMSKEVAISEWVNTKSLLTQMRLYCGLAIFLQKFPIFFAKNNLEVKGKVHKVSRL